VINPDHIIPDGETRPVVVCTARRAVVFGYARGDLDADPLTLQRARMCIYWPKEVGGVFGLGERGPNFATRVSARLDSLRLKEITAVFSVTSEAEKAWNAAPVQGQ
jgi:hypothetical protein